MATHSSILAWRIPWTEEPVRATVHGVTESDTTERVHTHIHTQEESAQRPEHYGVRDWQALRWDPALRKLSWGQRELLHCQGQLCSPSKTPVVPASRFLIHKCRVCTMGAIRQTLSCWLSQASLGESGCIKEKKCLFIFDGVGSWLFATCGLSLVVVSGGVLFITVPGFSLQWLLLSNTGSRVRLSTCGFWA